MKKLIDRLSNEDNLVIFTGAGVSTLCGIPDFRGPQGLYKQPNAERIFDITWFHRDPTYYYNGCRELIYGLKGITPGPVHRAIVKLEQLGSVTGVITQNIDMLHQKAGSKRVYELHGSPLKHRCLKCGAEATFEEVCQLLETSEVAWCAKCAKPFKPDVTFFGEMLPQGVLESAAALAAQASLMLVLGSSLTVHPAASLPGVTLQNGGDLAIINAQPTPYDHQARYRYHDLAEFANAF